MKTSELILREIEDLRNELTKTLTEEYKLLSEPFLKQKFFKDIKGNRTEYISVQKQDADLLIVSRLISYNDHESYCCYSNNNFSLSQLAEYKVSTKQEYESALETYFQHIKKTSF